MKLLSREQSDALGRSLSALLVRVLHRVPLRGALAFGRGIGWLAPRISRRHARRLAADITCAFGDTMTPREIDQLVTCSYQHLGQSMMEFFRSPNMSTDDIRAWTVMDDTHYLDAALAKGKGVLILASHLGNWELCGMGLAVHGYPLTAIARSQAGDGITEMLNEVRQKHGMKIIPMEDIRGALRVLKNNELLGILADTNANIPGAFVDFLGYPAATFTGTAFFALRTGAPIIPCFSQRGADLKHHITLGPPVPLSRTGDETRDLLITTMRCQQVISAEIRRRPAEWFWLNQRWKTRPEDIPQPERIPMQHRDLSPEESAAALRWTLADSMRELE